MERLSESYDDQASHDLVFAPCFLEKALLLGMRNYNPGRITFAEGVTSIFTTFYPSSKSWLKSSTRFWASLKEYEGKACFCLFNMCVCIILNCTDKAFETITTFRLSSRNQRKSAGFETMSSKERDWRFPFFYFRLPTHRSFTGGAVETLSECYAPLRSQSQPVISKSMKKRRISRPSSATWSPVVEQL